MKSELLIAVAVAGVSFAGVQGASAVSTVVAAFYDFGGTTHPENYPPRNYFAPGISGGVTKGKASWVTGGSSDADLGDFHPALFTVPQIPGGDGHLRIGADSANEGAVLRVSNLSGRSWGVDSLYFDAAAGFIWQEVIVWWSFDSVSWTFVFATGGPLTFAGSGSLADYGDYGMSLPGITLEHGASIYFKFAASGSATVCIDNMSG